MRRDVCEMFPAPAEYSAEASRSRRGEAALMPRETGTLIAATESMTRSLEVVIAICCTMLAASAFESVSARAQREADYRIEARVGRVESLRGSFSDAQLSLLEKLNRADLEHLAQLPEVVVPVSWREDELSYSVLPLQYSSSEAWPTFLVVYLPGQVFGAYEFGDLVRWGPVSTGGRNSPTSAGRFALNWRSTGRASTVDPDWFMRWYFNFGNREGLAFHEYSLPGYPASHGCIRLLERDARWLFGWGQGWVVDSGRTRVVAPGTPVLILGRYDFDAPPPWRSLEWLSATVDLPSISTTETVIAPGVPATQQWCCARSCGLPPRSAAGGREEVHRGKVDKAVATSPGPSPPYQAATNTAATADARMPPPDGRLSNNPGLTPERRVRWASSALWARDCGLKAQLPFARSNGRRAPADLETTAYWSRSGAVKMAGVGERAPELRTEIRVREADQGLTALAQRQAEQVGRAELGDHPVHVSACRHDA